MSSTQVVKSFLIVILGLVVIGLITTSFMRWKYAQKIEPVDNNQISTSSAQKKAMNQYQTAIAAHEAQVQAHNQAVLLTQQMMKKKLEAQVQQIVVESSQQNIANNIHQGSRYSSDTATKINQYAANLPTNNKTIKTVSNSEKERRKSRDKINKETCVYWQKKSLEVASEYNKSNKEKACARYYASMD